MLHLSVVAVYLSKSGALTEKKERSFASTIFMIYTRTTTSTSSSTTTTTSASR